MCVAIGGAAFALHQCSQTVNKPLDTLNSAVQTVLSWPEKIAAATGQLLQAKTTISGTSVSLPVEEIAELALVKRKILVYTKQTNSTWGSTAVRIIKGEYELKAGYDLKKVAITFSEPERTITIALPKAQILSMTTINQDTYHLDGGMIKLPNTAENDQGNKENRTQAYVEAIQLGISNEVEERMKERLRDLFSGITDPAKIIFTDSSNAATKPKM